MSRLPAAAAAYVDANAVLRPVHFVYMDFDGDPVRANDSGMTIVISGQSDPDLNGTYDGVTGDMASISPIRVGAGGSDTVSAKLSGLKGIDDDTLDLMGDETKWKGRIVKVWRVVWNPQNVQQGEYEHIYTGYMMDVTIGGDVDVEAGQYIEVAIENYLALYVQPSNRTYLTQHEFDPGDRSGEASLSPGGSHGHAGTGGIGAGGGSFNQRVGGLFAMTGWSIP